jgi:nitrogen regulatory protein PII
MELYYVISIVDRDRGDDMIKLCDELKLTLILRNLAFGTATSEHLAIYDLDETEKTIVTTVASAGRAKQLIRAAKRKLYIDIPGNGIIVSVPIKSVDGLSTLKVISDGQDNFGGKPDMEFEHELIVVILNEGYSDAVMAAARSAGATGGTVFHAKGTGKQQSAHFHGVSLADEKDMIYILAAKGIKNAIMSAVNHECGTGTKAGAISFSLPVSDVAGIRTFDEEQ